MGKTQRDETYDAAEGKEHANSENNQIKEFESTPQIPQESKANDDDYYIGLSRTYNQADNQLVFLFPFSCTKGKSFPKRKGSFIKNCVQSFDTWEQDDLINQDTRFFDYIINSFYNKQLTHEPNICLLSKEIDLINKQTIAGEFSRFRKELTGDKQYIQKRADKILIDNKFVIIPMQYKICIFDTKICFFGIVFNIKHKNNMLVAENDYHNLFMTLRRFSRSQLLVSLIKSLIPSCMEVSFFEEKKPVDGKNAFFTIRSILFANLNLNYTFDNCLIPYWVSRQIVLKRNKGEELPLPENKVHCYNLIPHNCVSASTEGCCVLNTIKEKTPEAKYVRKTARFYFQHVFLSYLLVLHQYFYLHHITAEASNLDVVGKSSLMQYCEYRAIEEEYAYFRTKYMFEVISARNDYQKMYNYLKNALGIEPFLEEAKYSIEPIQIIADKKVENRKGVFLGAFSIFTLTNVIINLYNAFSTGITPSKQLLLIYLIGSFLIFTILSLCILPNAWLRKLIIREKKIKRKIKKNLTRVIELSIIYIQ